MNSWQNIYNTMDPVAFSVFGFNIHWYSLMYVSALIVAVLVAKYLIARDKTKISSKLFDSYIFWVEIGVILGARIGYILIYDPHTSYYLTHFWQIFNPFIDGQFVGIRGMSYHGAIVGFFIASYIFTLKHKINHWMILDVAAVAIPAGYVFGRIGNFLNQELIGNPTNLPWGILVDKVLVHPSQLYEAFLEGIVIFIILFFYRNKKRFDGELIIIYTFLYGVFRIVSEFFRAPDFQIGYVLFDTITLGQLLSSSMIALAIIVWIVKYKKVKNIK